MKTLSVLSYNRTGSTIVGQAVASSLGLEYQAEITNIPDILMRYDENGKDVAVEYTENLPEGTYSKTYDIINDRVERSLNYNNPKPFIHGTPEYLLEVDKRSNLLRHNVKSSKKSIFKIQTQKFVEHFNDFKLLDDYSFIFCTRKDLVTQVLSYLTAINTKVFHVVKDTKTLEVKPFKIKKDKFDYIVRGLNNTHLMFEHYKMLGQISNIIFYEDWQNDPNKIFDILGLDRVPTDFWNKIKYNVNNFEEAIINIDEVKEWISNEPAFDYTYKL